MVAYGVQRDIDPIRWCGSSGVDLEALRDENFSLTQKQVSDLWTNAVHLSSDPLFGLHFGESLQLPALGVVGQVIQHSQTVGEALVAASSFVPLITDMFSLEVTRKEKAFTIHFRIHDDNARRYPDYARQQLGMCMAFTIHEIDGLLLKKLSPNSITLCEAVEHDQELERVFRVKPIGNSQSNSIEFDGKFWDAPIITADHYWQSLFVQKATSLLQARDKPNLKEKISGYLMSNAYLGIPTLEQIAANFNVSARSLQRRLQAEDVTYQQLADEVRKSLAIHYMGSGQYQIKEIAYMLGYNEVSAFTRAFKRWTGSAPVNYVN
jgi:AraC-like DNA-binding protein